MEQDCFQLTVLGSRGSMPVSSPDMRRYGGDTSCYMVQAGEKTVFLDAGSGLGSAPTEFEEPPVILLSHLHLDHLLGLGMYPRLSMAGQRTDIFLPPQPGGSAKQTLDALFSPPFWSCSLTDYRGEVTVRELSLPMRFGELTVDGLPGNHPGGCTVFRLTYRGKRLVYATDFEAGPGALDRLAEFAKGADLLLFDGMYTEEEAERNRGFGHSTAETGLELAERCGAKRLLLIHHDPKATDRMLDEREAALGNPNASYAREGTVIDLVSLEERSAHPEAEDEIRELTQALQRRDEMIRTTFGRYLTDEVLEEILSGKTGVKIAGERRAVTILFTDLRHSTELSEQMDAEAFFRMLNHYLEEMIEIINAWQGNILEFVGDAIVAVFGAPVANETSARDAVACSVAMQRRMEAVNAWNREQGFPELRMGIGIHTGEALLGNIGSQIRTKYDMIGRNVNLASRIEGFTEGGQILVSSETLAAAGEKTVLRENGSRWVRPRGIREEVQVHDVIGFGSQRIPEPEKTAES